ncbi:MAG: CPBP family intramembrane glutamic endopeptidase [Candidatus Nanoarchaeia archaeon]|jgi:membrane protease YdiL (CAAX protease family)
MVYSWILSSLNDSYAELSKKLLLFIFNFLIPRLIEIVFTPFNYPNILWIITPLIAATLLMIFYFGRYKNEQLGWNTAFGNNIALLFVGLNLLQVLWQKDSLLSNKAFFIYSLILYNIIQLIINYFHLVPKGISFIINSTLPVNFINYFAIIIVYSNINLDFVTLIAGIVFFLIIYTINKIIWVFVPMSKGSKIFVTLRQKKIEKFKEREERFIKRNENLSIYSDKMSKIGIVFYLILYFSLFIINKFVFDLKDYYLLILSAYFIIFSVIYLKKKKLGLDCLLLKGNPVKKDMGVLIGILIFFYYLVTSNLFTSLVKTNNYSPNMILLIFSILLTTISSEFFFRGIIQRALKIKNSKNKSVAIQALLWSILKFDVFNASFSTIHYALVGIVIIFPIGVLLGYVKEEWYLDSSISASLTAGILSIFTIFI